MTIDKDISKKYHDEIKQIQEEYKSALLNHLKEMHLDGRVVRLEDGKEGKLCIEHSRTYSLGCVIRFYPYTAKGTISKRDDWVNTMIDLTKQFKSKEEE